MFMMMKASGKMPAFCIAKAWARVLGNPDNMKLFFYFGDGFYLFFDDADHNIILDHGEIFKIRIDLLSKFQSLRYLFPK
jgi:hypothetical protein